VNKDHCIKCKWCIGEFDEFFCDYILNQVIDYDEDGLAIGFYYQNIKDINNCSGLEVKE
jgi:hypothetical protein